MKARGVWFVAPFEVELRDVEVPEPSDGQVLVSTRYSGISGGTEMLAYRGQLDPELPLDERLGGLRGTFRYPFAYGYSVVGVVERSRGPVPEGSLVFAFHPHQDRLVVDAADVLALEGVDPRVATLYPIVETGLQVTLDAAPRLGDVVAVVGLGPVGTVAAALLSRAGARVLGADRRAGARTAAAALGVTAVDPADLGAEVRDRTSGRGCDVVVEASGDPAALGPALDLLAHEGTALVCSWYGTKAVALPLGGAFHRRRLVIRSSQVSTIPAALSARWDVRRRREEARRLLGELPLRPLATHEFAFEEAPVAYAALDRGDDGLLHAALRCG
ncbi:MAG TPA: zinc-binding alcohol dehydrogenase [Actinomycetota bacterium]|nr:zinc-binding alcohol dehydrogenase [Actinomycetota bacterium]